VFGFRGLLDRLTEDFPLGGVLFFSGRTFDAEAPVPETAVPGRAPNASDPPLGSPSPYDGKTQAVRYPGGTTTRTWAPRWSRGSLSLPPRWSKKEGDREKEIGAFSGPFYGVCCTFLHTKNSPTYVQGKVRQKCATCAKLA
jgi:hypothetical protein